MKKRIIALSVAAALGGVAGTASAQNADYLVFNPDGVGHILVVPYFSAQGGNATLLNIVNTDQVHGKALKVRFRGASNSDDIFDFQLYLSAGDVWAANISQGPNGYPRLTTSDKSCTLPAVVSGQDFINTRLNTVDLSGDALANEAREGYVEILNMGDISTSTATSSVWVATKHNSAGTPPCTVSVLENLTQADSKLSAPTTGLMANWTIINVPQTTVWAGEAAAIEARTGGLAAAGNNVFWPQKATALTPGEVAAYTADPLFRAGLVEGANYDLPDLSTPYLVWGPTPQAQANQLSDALASKTVAGEYLSSATINASTDWVVSKPTRRYYVAVDYAETTPADRLVTNFDDNTDGSAVYYRSKLTDGDTTFGNTVMGNAANGGKTWQACVQVSSVKFYNREEGSPVSSGIVISPGQPAPAPSLCGEVSVLGINSPTSPLAASVSRFNVQLPAGFADGWGSVTAANTFSSEDLGLPMLVNQFSKATNPAVSPGVSGTFGARWSGRVTTRGAFFTPF